MNRFLKFLFCIVSLVAIAVNDVSAQARRRATAPARPPARRGNNTVQQPAVPATNTPAKPVQSSQTPSKIPYVTITSSSGSGNGINDTIKQSLRPDNIIEANLVKDRSPLVYKFIREDDAVYKQRIWREIDAREKINLPFRYSLVENSGSQRFISILISAVKSGVTAFDPIDDRFTTPMTSEQALGSLSSGKPDTIPVNDLDGNIVKYNIMSKEPNLDSVFIHRIKIRFFRHNIIFNNISI